MNDMSQVIISKSDQINSADLIGGPMTITISEVEIKGGQEQPVSIYFNDSEKAFRPCKSMSRVLVAAWGPDAKVYVGRSLTLYRDPTVKWGGMEVGGIRISHMTNLDSAMTMVLTATKGSHKPFTVKPLAAAADKVADGVRALIVRINSADADDLAVITADPAVVKQRAWLVKNRPELASEVDAAIALVPAADDPFGLPPLPTHEPEGRAGADPHPAESLATRLIERIASTEMLVDVGSIIAGAKADLDAMPDELARSVRDAAETRKAEISGGGDGQ